MSINTVVLIILIVFLVYYLYRVEQKSRQRTQLQFIAGYKFPQRVRESVLKKYPHLKESDVDLVIQGLRDFFHISNQAKGEMVSMPSQVVDVAWHEFILFTRAYQKFSRKAFGKFFHHHPVEAMRSQTEAQEGIKRAWKLSCEKEDIHIERPDRLPLLFALDNQLDIEDGFRYALNCRAYDSSASSSFCASDIACSGSSSCAGDSLGGNSSCSGSSCSGGGCGGGCGGA